VDRIVVVGASLAGLTAVETLREENFAGEAWLKDENGNVEYGERDYDKVPMNAFESFCDEHFGGIVGG